MKPDHADHVQVVFGDDPIQDHHPAADDGALLVPFMGLMLVLMTVVVIAMSVMSIAELPGFYTVPECAQKARVSPWTIRKEIQEGRLIARRIGRCVRITDEELARWMRGQR